MCARTVSPLGDQKDKCTAECAAKDKKRVLCVSFFCEGIGSVEDLA